MKINAGGATGGSPSGQEVHEDFTGEMMKLPQANGGVPTKVTSFKQGGEYEGEPISKEERHIGDMSKDKFGSMNGEQAGQTRGQGGREGLYNER